MAGRIGHLVRIGAEQLNTDGSRLAVMRCPLTRFAGVSQLGRCAHHFADRQRSAEAPGETAIGLVTDAGHGRGDHPALQRDFAYRQAGRRAVDAGGARHVRTVPPGR